MKVTDYPKTITKPLKAAVSWLNKNEKFIKKLAGLPVFNTSFGASNWGMPKGIFNKLDKEQRMWLSTQTSSWCETSKPCETLKEPVVKIPIERIQV